MFKFVGGLLCGAAATYSLSSYFNPHIRLTLDHEEYQMVNTYISNHKLEKLLKLSIMSGFSQLNKSFLEYGLKVKLDGFNYYSTLFEKEQI